MTWRHELTVHVDLHFTSVFEITGIASEHFDNEKDEPIEVRVLDTKTKTLNKNGRKLQKKRKK